MYQCLTRTGAFAIDITIENDHFMSVLQRCMCYIHAINSIAFMSDDVININIEDIAYILAT